MSDANSSKVEPPVRPEGTKSISTGEDAPLTAGMILLIPILVVVFVLGVILL